MRDILQDKPPKDVDMATDALPQQMVALCEAAGVKYILTGIQHGTLTLMLDKDAFEVTTLRVDKVTDGRHAEVEFTLDWELDAARRDLTINALSVDQAGNVFDYFGGVEHLKECRVLFVGRPADRIKEDYLRILRYFRFFGRISGNTEHDEATLEAIRTGSEGLQGISRERIWLEMAKISVGPYAPQILRLMSSLGLFPYMELEAGVNIERFESVHNAAVRGGLRPVALWSFAFDNEAEFAEHRKIWKMSGEEDFIGKFVIKHRGKTEVKHFQDIMVDAPNQMYGKYLEAFIQLCLCRGGDEELRRGVEKWEVPKCPISGGIVVKHFGVKGPLVSKLFTKGKNEWKKSYFTLTKDEILEVLKKDVP